MTGSQLLPAARDRSKLRGARSGRTCDPARPCLVPASEACSPPSWRKSGVKRGVSGIAVRHSGPLRRTDLEDAGNMSSKPNAPVPDAALPPPVELKAAAEPVQVELKVPFHDCDPLFVVWHGRYFEYLEVARSALFARHQLDVEQVRALNYRMYVTDARCRYMFPLTYNDRVRVSARFTSLRPLLRVAYDVYNLTVGRKTARAVTVLATTDVMGNLLSETPADLIERLQAVGGEHDA